MRTTYSSIKTALLALTVVSLAADVARADTYSWTNLQSDIAGVATNVDPDLVNPWGMAASAGGTIWVSDNGTGVSTLYQQDGTALSLVVTIPGRNNKKGGNPTGVVFNSTAFFKVTKNGNSQPSKFIFVSEDGTISGWNPTLDNTNAIVAVKGKSGNVYKAATLGVSGGHNFLYVTDFFSAQVTTFDENFAQAAGFPFADPNIPKGFAPFAIRNLNGEIFVTYALQANGKKDDQAGPGNGFVNVFDTHGNLLRRLVSHGNLNSPWGLALVNGELWVGNFGDGRINNYDPMTGTFIETISRLDGTPLDFDGLWDLLPLGTGVYFTAGIGDEAHGLFGLITED